MPTSNNLVLLFDLGGVLIENQMFAELKRLMQVDRTEAQLIEMWLSNPVARQFELGQCSAGEFSQSIIQEFQLPLAADDFLQAFKGWPKGFYTGVEPMLLELKKSATVCALSNSNEVHWTRLVTDHFDHAYSSHLIGCIKPDRNAFDHVLEALDVEAKSVHFFDDALMNVEAAQGLGFNAHHTVGFDNLRSKLGELGFYEP